MWTASFLTVMMCAASNQVPDSVEINLHEPPHPCVFLTRAEVESVRARAESQDWARSVANGIVRSADKLVAEPLDIPHKEGQWTHWYNCKKDGARLRPESPTKHVCPKCGEEYTGWPYDAVYVSLRHRHWMSGVMTLGLAYMLTEKPEYAEQTKSILLEFASFYEDLDIHDIHDKDNRPRRSGARLMAQTLDEAVQLCPVAVGYDMVYDAECFSPGDHETIADHLLHPMVDTIMRHRAGKSNWQSWHNAAIACAGFVLRDREMVDTAINDPKHGFLFQMRESVLPSGMWYEGAPSYHWYALSAHLYLLEAAARAGIDVYDIGAVKGLFDAPLRQLFPDGTFPAVHDSGRSHISGARQYYEVAYKRYGDKMYATLLRPRDTEWGLIWGSGTVPEADGKVLPLGSSNEPAEGLAILRDKRNETALYLDYSPRYGGHIHPCRLNIILFAHDNERIVDPGRLLYGNPMHSGWYRQTLAHNTVLVDETGQRHAPAELKAFAAAGDWSLVRAVCTRAYDDVMLDRTLFMQGNVIVDLFQCTAKKPSKFDLPLHFRGRLEGLPPGEPRDQLADAPGYRVLMEVESLQKPLESFAVATADDRKIHVYTFDPSEAFTAVGYGKSLSERLPMVLRRQSDVRNAAFLTVYQLSGDENGEQLARDAFKLKHHPIRNTITGVEFDGILVNCGPDTVISTENRDTIIGPKGIVPGP